MTIAAFALGDLNGDGKLDLASANNGDANVDILLNTGGGVFGTAASCPCHSAPASIALDDLNGDGKLYLATARTSTTGGLTVLINNSP